MTKKPLFVKLQYIVPQHFLSRLIGRLMNSRQRWLKNALINWFIRRYKVDMSLAENPDPAAYISFNDFFTRRLKEGVRPVAAGSDSLVSPADGTISQLGSISDDKLLQAKGVEYHVSRLVGDEEWAEFFKEGEFMTIYLSPKDYHRVHMPLAGKLIGMRYIPGQLFSVNPLTTEYVPELFALNERAICLFETEHGKMAVVFVGAMLVAAIHTVFAGEITPALSTVEGSRTFFYENQSFEKGQELGHFCLGSTVIVLLQKNQLTWETKVHPGQTVVMGEALATVENKIL